MKKKTKMLGVAALMALPALVCAQSLPEQTVTNAEKHNNHEQQLAQRLKIAEAENFVKKRLPLIEHIKPLTTAQKQQLTEKFITRMQSGEGSNIGALRAILSKTTTDTAYFTILFKEEIEKTAKAKTAAFLEKKQLDDGKGKALQQLVYAYHRELALSAQTLTAHKEKKEEERKKIEQRYKPLIDNELITNAIKLPFTNYLGMAIAQKDKLKIDGSQLTALNNAIAQINKQKADKNAGEKFNLKKYELQQLSQLLSETQLDNLFTLALADKAKKIAEEKMLQIKQAKLDTTNVQNELYDYYLKKLKVQERFAHHSPQLAQLKKPEDTKPEILTVLDATNYSKTSGVTVTKYIGLAMSKQEQLKLDEKQVQALQNANNEFIKQKAAAKKTDQKFDAKQYELQQLAQLLNETQLNTLLTLALTDRAQKIAEEKMQQIKQKGLDKNIDTNNAQNQLVDYYLNKIVIQERFANNPSQQEAQLKKLEQNKPEILTAQSLDQQNKTSKVSATKYIGLAISKQEQLKIDEKQVEALQNANNEFIKQKAAAKKTDQKFDAKQYELQQLAQLLNDTQLNSLLTLALTDRAKKIAEEKMQQIKQEGLDKNIDTTNVQKQLFGYYLNKLVAKERFANNSPQQLAQIKSLDTGKPKILAKLGAAQRNTQQKDNIKSALLW